MIILITVLIILAILSIVASLVSDESESGLLLFVDSIIIGVIAIGFIVEYNKGPKPEAIEVYRNNTNLQINYKVINNDTIITDSIVIFKQNVFNSIQ